MKRTKNEKMFRITILDQIYFNSFVVTPKGNFVKI